MTLYGPNSRILALALLIAALEPPVPGDAAPDAGRHRLDGGLRRVVDGGTPGPFRSPGQDPVHPRDLTFFLRGSLDPEDLERIGLRVGTRVGDLLTARGTATAAARLSRLEGLERAYLAAPVRPFLDVSVPAVRGDSVRTRTGDQWSGQTGTGVLVGFVDSGIDPLHGDFLRADGTTRVRFLWDQTDPSSDQAPPPYGYGREWTAAEIDAGTVTAEDETGHGTHVAGIAAGDGSASQVDSLRFRFPGVAPEADILVVDAVLLDANIVDAVDYLLAKAAALDRPIVVNLSLGSQFGPHDGTALLDQALDALAGPGKILVAAAGNEANDGIHAELTVPPGGSDSASIVVPDYEPAAGANFMSIDAFYRQPDVLGVTVVTPEGRRFGPYLLGAEQPDTLTGQGTLLLVHWDPDPSGNNLEVQIDVSNFDPPGQTAGAAAPVPAPGLWRIVFSDAGGVGAGGEVDLWLPLADPLNPRWDVDRLDPTEEIATPASAISVIAVGAFNTKTCWLDSLGGEQCTSVLSPLSDPGRESFFSSRGPTRDGRQVPVVAAPGFVIASAYSRQTSPEARADLGGGLTLDPDGEHYVTVGTSMAAPHVSGAVALLLAEEPELTPEEVKQRLVASALKDTFTGDGWHPALGFGKLNVKKLLDPNLVPVWVGELRITWLDRHPRLTWESPRDAGVVAFRLLSRTEHGIWQGRARFLGPGPHHWEDPAPLAGTRYRLEASLRNGETAVWAEGVLPAPPRPRLELGPAHPNPFVTETTIPVLVPGAQPGARYDARVLDAAGRLVQSLRTGSLDPAGRATVVWNGLTASGRRAPVGQYWLRIDAGGRTGALKLVRLH